MSIDGTLFLEQLTEKLKYRIEELDVVISEGQKDVESMHEYYWENYTEMDEYGYENYDNQQALLRHGLVAQLVRAPPCHGGHCCGR